MIKEKREKRYVKALARVEEIKKYYKHLSVYLIINMVISISKIVDQMGNGDTFMEALATFETYKVWIFWGVGLLVHTFVVFGSKLLWNKDWEERQLKKYMDSK